MGKLIEAALEARIDALIADGLRKREQFKREMPKKAYADILSECKNSIDALASDMGVALLTAALLLMDEPKDDDTTDEEHQLFCDFTRIALVELLEAQKDKAALPAGV